MVRVSILKVTVLATTRLGTGMRTNEKSTIMFTDVQAGGFIAKVASVNNHEAIDALTDEGNRINITAHAASVGPLKTGDRVVINSVNQMYIVMCKLRDKNEQPMKGFVVNDDGSLTIDNMQGIKISVGGAKVEISKDGRVYIDSKEIYAIAEGLQRLQAAKIELN